MSPLPNLYLKMGLPAKTYAEIDNITPSYPVHPEAGRQRAVYNVRYRFNVPKIASVLVSFIA